MTIIKIAQVYGEMLKNMEKPSDFSKFQEQNEKKADYPYLHQF